MYINGKTRIYGIIGHPVTHTFSPKMQNAAFEALGINAVYLPFEVHPSRLKEAMDGIRSLSIHGINCTIPHKEAVLTYLDAADPLARKIGAVNTIVTKEGKLKGYNTDGAGFIRSLEEIGFSCGGKKVVILGSGGSAKGIAFSLAESGVSEITLLSRNMDKGLALISSLKEHYPGGEFNLHSLPLEGVEELLELADLLVNTTPVGMVPQQDQSPLESLKGLSSRALVADIIYAPRKTKLLQMAEERGIQGTNGLGMLLHQGAIAFELWTGEKAPLEVMRKVLLEQIQH